MPITTIDPKDIARAQFERFHDELQKALRIAAERNKWCPDTWMLQVTMVASAIELKDATVEELVAAYRVPPL
jgi:NADH:ubiquinone oxidoreductase subunit E